MISLTLNATDPKQGRYELDAQQKTDEEDYRLAGAVERVRGLILHAPVVKFIVRISVNGSSVTFSRDGDVVPEEQIDEVRARLKAILEKFMSDLAR